MDGISCHTGRINVPGNSPRSCGTVDALKSRNLVRMLGSAGDFTLIDCGMPLSCGAAVCENARHGALDTGVDENREVRTGS